MATVPSGWGGRCLPLCVTLALVAAVTGEVLWLLLRAGGSRPDPDPDPPGLALHLPALLFLLANVLGNMGLFVTTSPSIGGVMLAGAAVGKGWAYCYTCQSHVPPRCHHCYACNVCMLRRDHHCVLLGQCVGYRNYRYFLCLLLHGWAALLYASLLNGDIFMDLLREGVTLSSIFLLFMPWLMLLTGQVSTSTFICVFMADICVVGFLFCSGFLFFHVLLSLRGQTVREWFEENRSYDLGWHRNLQEALGDRWHLVWLCPLLASPLPGDGVTFESRAPCSEPSAKPVVF
ncbi:putative palmitoyltransferase ZDHHC24 [Carettochelys insculpta]|uniref:putative palmitoyltransferase ZDHHC24 n=1 Tax=Carettochelys insculpta TaxID=44489 RepID=UPI003EBED22C